VKTNYFYLGASNGGKNMSNDSLTITDNRTGRTYEIPIVHDTIDAMKLRQIKVNPAMILA
jgi:hypothetical protein